MKCGLNEFMDSADIYDYISLNFCANFFFKVI